MARKKIVPRKIIATATFWYGLAFYFFFYGVLLFFMQFVSFNLFEVSITLLKLDQSLYQTQSYLFLFIMAVLFFVLYFFLTKLVMNELFCRDILFFIFPYFFSFVIYFYYSKFSCDLSYFVKCDVENLLTPLGVFEIFAFYLVAMVAYLFAKIHSDNN